jgi:DNA-binding PadR family transcriptional regulator
MEFTLGPGTLYTAISRIVEQKLIAPAARDGRQRPYRLTAQGTEALEERLTAMRRVAAFGLRRLRTA